MAAEILDVIQRRIKESGGRGQASHTSVSSLPRIGKTRRLGLAMGPETLQKRKFRFQAEAQARLPPFPPRFDWRSHRGVNWVSRIADQGGCGSCVAFACVAVLECQLAIETGTSHSLSEAFLFFCGGARCEAGWDVEPALRFVQNNGVTDWDCFPYSLPAGQHSCSEACPNWAERVYRIKRFQMHSLSDFVKNLISNRGPMIAAMDVYDDFSYYSGGTYSHVYGDNLGAHAVAVIGYDDALSHWICKNSWGDRWGEHGFFQLQYGQCGMCVQYPLWGVEGVVPP